MTKNLSQAFKIYLTEKIGRMKKSQHGPQMFTDLPSHGHGF